MPESEPDPRARFNGDLGDTLGLDGVEGSFGGDLESLEDRNESLTFDLKGEQEGVRELVGNLGCCGEADGLSLKDICVCALWGVNTGEYRRQGD